MPRGSIEESTTLNDGDRGELVEADSTVFKHMDREMHFLSLHSNEKQVDKVRRFKTWLISAVTG